MLRGKSRDLVLLETVGATHHRKVTITATFSVIYLRISNFYSTFAVEKAQKFAQKAKNGVKYSMVECLKWCKLI